MGGKLSHGNYIEELSSPSQDAAVRRDWFKRVLPSLMDHNGKRPPYTYIYKVLLPGFDQVLCSLTGRRKGRSQSVLAHSAINQRPPTLSSSGPIIESHQAFLQTSSSVHELAQRPSGSRLSLHNSAASLHSQPPPVTTTGHLSVRERAEALIRSSLGSSTSSTLSFLFGKRSFSSALVISGLSAAEGGNTSDTQSSSSVNIVMGPSARAASHAARVRTAPGWETGRRHQRAWGSHPPVKHFCLLPG